jgi:hypothetical protein
MARASCPHTLIIHYLAAEMLVEHAGCRDTVVGGVQRYQTA